MNAPFEITAVKGNASPVATLLAGDNSVTAAYKCTSVALNEFRRPDNGMSLVSLINPITLVLQ
jgi:hypothetical protein